MQPDVTKQLEERFAAPLAGAARRRIVVWHDADAQFAELFDALASGDAGMCEGERPLRFLKAEDGSLFAAKKLLARDDVESDFLVYRQQARGVVEGDWLADVELYSEHFQADYLSMLVDQLGAADTPDVRNALGRHRAFFASKERTARFTARMPAPQTGDDVTCGVLAALIVPKGVAGAAGASGAGVGPGTGAAGVAPIVRSWLSALLEENAKPAEALARFGMRDSLARFLEKTCGYGGDVDDARGLASHLLLSAASCLMPKGALDGLEAWVAPRNAAVCLGVVRDWMQGPQPERAVLYDACRLVENAHNLPLRFAKLPLQSLCDCDVFPAANEAILAQLLASIADGADRADEALAIVGRRKGMKWYKHLSMYFDLLSHAAQAQKFYQAHAGGFHMGLAADIWRAYEQDWHAMDATYRHFTAAFRACLRDANPQLEDAARACAGWLEGLYRNWYLDESNACWIAAAEKQWWQAGYVEGPERQRRLYDRVVLTEIGPSKHAVVVVSDALRYEVARELAQRLERETRGSCEVSSAQGTFPSITEFGMAALLPHRALEYREAENAVYVDGLPTATTAQREAVLRAKNPKSRALRAEEFMALPRDVRKELLRESAVVYLYHNKIDSTGESAPTEADVFDACETSIRDISALVKRIVGDTPSAQVVVTADHGFLYAREPLAEYESVSRRELPEGSLLSGKRYAILDGQVEEDPVFVRLDMADVDGGSYVGVAPRQAIRIKGPGGTRNYVHGGISLQELVVPVVRFRNQRAGSKGAAEVRRAELRLLTTNRRITSGLFKVELYQSEPVSGKVAPCEYELVFADGSGNEISDTRRAVADRESADEQARIMSVQFALRASRQFASGEPGYLLCRSKETGQITWQEEFRMEMAFAPLDDFGF